MPRITRSTVIGYLSGKLIEHADQNVIIDVQNVGYEVYVGKSPCCDLPHLGGNLSVWIHTHVREDQISLFGFRTPQQRRLFVLLNTISGVGPKLAYAILGQFNESQLVRAIGSGDAALLKSVPGVGKKMAERIVLELSEKLGGLVGLELGSAHTVVGSIWGDLVDALTGLGFPEPKIKNVIRLLQSEYVDNQPPLDQLVKTALQKINAC